MILFLSEKISWDQDGKQPYLVIIEEGITISLERRAYYFVNYLMDNKDELAIIHPWLREAHLFFKELILC